MKTRPVICRSGCDEGHDRAKALDRSLRSGDTVTMETRKEKWESRYETADLPWDTGRHDSNLESVVADWPIRPCRAIDIGCGTGSNAIWLSQHGFDVTATDISSLALAEAQRKVAELDGITIRFEEADIYEEPLPAPPYALAFDRGCFHSSDAEAMRDIFVQRVYDCLSPGGLWFSMIGSTDSPPRETGPPVLSACQITQHVESLFEILFLKAIHFDSNQSEPPAAWACLMRRR